MHSALSRRSAYLLHCALPLVTLLGCLLAVLLFPRTLLASAVTVAEVGVPILPFILLMTFGAVIASFRAHFSEPIRPLASWLTILFSGALVVLIFAVMHQAATVMCTAPICPGAETWFATEQGFRATRTSPQDVPVRLDSQFRTAFYFSVVTFTTLGYGDMQPVADMRLYTAYEAVIGYVYLGMVVGTAMDFGNNPPWHHGRSTGALPPDDTTDAAEPVTETASPAPGPSRSDDDPQSLRDVDDGEVEDGEKGDAPGARPPDDQSPKPVLPISKD